MEINPLNLILVKTPLIGIKGKFFLNKCFIDKLVNIETYFKSLSATNFYRDQNGLGL
jgi:hypothetical protein